MTLKEIFPHLMLPAGVGGLKPKGICEDSRIIKDGDVFFALPRPNFDIFSVLKNIEPKVSAYIVPEIFKARYNVLRLKKPAIFVKDIQKEFNCAVDRFFKFNTRDFTFIGVTGTNGKTTTVALISHLLKKLGTRTALLGTVCYEIGSRKLCATHTTPDYLSLRKLFHIAKKEKARYVVMEVSSHALAQKRNKGIDFEICVFTNLSRDHLDYHKTMESYFSAKRKLFQCNPRALSLVNIDDAYGRRLLTSARHPISYGISKRADLRAKEVRLSIKGTKFELIFKGKVYPVFTPLLGKHNVSNILAALATLVSLGFPLKKVISFIPSFTGAEGRLQNQGRNIFVDYAHTPDALEKAFSALKSAGFEKIICVFGCGGNRDKGKRAMMGAVSDKYAHFTFITSDNPRQENPADICSQIEEGFKNSRYAVIIDRKKAIKRAIKLCAKTVLKGYNKCCVLVAGKGHEDCQILGDEKIPFKDSRVIKELLKYEYA
ncbi:MAG: UDP-N-acetylmuramoyl-L-alanyl-D-glutamate--2,6-diaminopimelate ligase [Candidatus Omnitrophica bacterium]|nr:UDP-N-acetylmuramoyl-L-alanyl-D-glutamate--2,6-diaminopimelate ligase [Candidatus Omnitrophota bacterium]